MRPRLKSVSAGAPSWALVPASGWGERRPWLQVQVQTRPRKASFVSSFQLPQPSTSEANPDAARPLMHSPARRPRVSTQSRPLRFLHVVPCPARTQGDRGKKKGCYRDALLFSLPPLN